MDKKTKPDNTVEENNNENKEDFSYDEVSSTELYDMVEGNETIEESSEKVSDNKEQVIGNKTNEQTKESEGEDKQPTFEDENTTQKQPEQIDREAFKKEITQEVAQTIIENLQGEKKKDEEVYPWEKEGRNPSYKEALDYVKESAKKELKEELDREEQEKAQQAEEAKKAQESMIQEFNESLDRDIEALDKLNFFPDNKAQKEKAVKDLQAQMYEHNEERVKNGEDLTRKDWSLIQFATSGNYKPMNLQPAGADAPVSLGRKGVTNTRSDSDFFYKDIANSSFDDLLEEV